MSAQTRTAPFRAARAYLNQRPLAVTLALLSSLAASLCVVALLPLGYLGIDLLDTHGRIAAYADLPAVQQAAFRDEWAAGVSARPGVVERLAQLKAAPLSDKPTTADWEVRHAAAVGDDLSRLVSPVAAEAYHSALTDELGVLATVTRQRHNVGGRVLGVGSIELARPLARSLPAFWGAVFVDAGNAAADWQSYKPAIGYGVGLRWRSPVGPLRVDFARGVDVHRWRLHFSVGIAL